MKFIQKAFIVASLLIVAPACSSVLKALPTVIKYVQDAQMILDMIDRQAQPLLEQFGSDEVREEYAKALHTTQQALHLALRATKGTDELSKEQVDEAFENFREAYKNLLGVLRRAGLMNADGSMKAAPGHAPITVPDPMALKPE